MFNVAPSVFPSRLSPRSRTKIRTLGEDVIVAETTRRGNSCDPKVKTMIPNKVGRAQGHYRVHNRRGCSSISRPDRCAPKVLTRRGVTDLLMGSPSCLDVLRDDMQVPCTSVQSSRGGTGAGFIINIRITRAA